MDQWVREQFSPVDQTAEGMLTSLSQARRLLAGQQAVRRAIEGLEAGFTPDLASLDITDAASAVGEVTGDTVTEKMIDNIFSKFCVGK